MSVTVTNLFRFEEQGKHLRNIATNCLLKLIYLAKLQKGESYGIELHYGN